MWTRWDDWIDEAQTAPALLSVLGSEGFDEAVLKHCRADKSFEDRVLNSYVEGARDHGVDRTPTFLIDGRKFVGLPDLYGSLLRTFGITPGEPNPIPGGFGRNPSNI